MIHRWRASLRLALSLSCEVSMILNLTVYPLEAQMVIATHCIPYTALEQELQFTVPTPVLSGPRRQGGAGRHGLRSSSHNT